MTLERIANEVVARGGLRVGKSSVDRMLKHMGFKNQKKSLIADEQTRTDVASSAVFSAAIVQTFMGGYDALHLLSMRRPANTKMTRLYGARQSARAWSLGPARPLEDDHFCRGIGTRRHRRPRRLRQADDGPSFLAYVEQAVAPVCGPATSS